MLGCAPRQTFKDVTDNDTYMLLYIIRKYFKSKLNGQRKAKRDPRNTEEHANHSNKTTMANLSADILCKEEKTEELENTRSRESENACPLRSAACPIKSPFRKRQKKQTEDGRTSMSDESSCPANILKLQSSSSSPNLSEHDCYVRIDTQNPKESKTQLLGSGANSDVYALSEKIVIKVYKNNAKQCKIDAETVTLKALKGIPNIPRFMALTNNVLVVQNDNRKLHYTSEGECQRGLIMERIEGVDLFEALMHTREIPYPCPQNIIFGEIAPGILKILRNLHRLGSHRDLKLENIILKKKRKNLGDVAIIDFDTFTSNEVLNAQSLKSTKIVGTKAYISPEDRAFCSRGSPSDIWSLGVILLSLLGAAEICLNHNALYYHPGSANLIIDRKFGFLMPSYKNILYSMLEKDPTQRANASSILIALNKINEAKSKAS